jgi:hypothetical protein
MTTPQNQCGPEQQLTVILSVATLAEQSRLPKYILQDKITSRFSTSCNTNVTVNNRISWKCCCYFRFTDTWDGKAVKVLTSRLNQSQIWVRSACNRIAYIMTLNHLFVRPVTGIKDRYFKWFKWFSMPHEIWKFPALYSKCTKGTCVRNSTRYQPFGNHDVQRQYCR